MVPRLHGLDKVRTNKVFDLMLSNSPSPLYKIVSFSPKVYSIMFEINVFNSVDSKFYGIKTFLSCYAKTFKNFYAIQNLY